MVEREETVWEETRRRLDELAETVRRGRSPDPESVRRTLEERARRLAQPPPPPPPTDLLEVVIFRLARELYGVAAQAVEGVFRLTDSAPLPGAPSPIVGVTAHRGELLTLLDVRADLGLRPGALDDLGRVVVLRSGGHRAGVLVDHVEGTLTLRTSELTTVDEGRRPDRKLIVGVTPDVVAILDAEAILRFFDGGDDS